MSLRLFKFAGLAAVAGGAYFIYTKKSEQQAKEVNLLKAGCKTDDRIVHLSGKAKEAEQGATATVFQAKDQLQQAAASLTDTAASLTDRAKNGVDNKAEESKDALSSLKGWLTGK